MLRFSPLPAIQVKPYLPLEWTPEGMLERISSFVEYMVSRLYCKLLAGRQAICLSDWLRFVHRGWWVCFFQDLVNSYYHQYTGPNNKTALNKTGKEAGCKYICGPTHDWLRNYRTFFCYMLKNCVIWPSILMIIIITWLLSGILFICGPCSIILATLGRKWCYSGHK